MADRTESEPHVQQWPVDIGRLYDHRMVKTIVAILAGITITFGCGKNSERKNEAPATPKADCQVTGSCKACKETADCPAGETCTTFEITGRMYSGCISEHSCSAPQILSMAADKCGTSNPIAPAGSEGGSAAAPAGSAAPAK
jgi:hypothetical protein